MNKAEDCFQCGLCKSSCPVYESLLNERYSPRGKAILMKKNETDKTFYLCTLCGNCTSECPKKIELNVRKYREKLTGTMTTKANRLMIENIRKTGNPFGAFEKFEDEEDENYVEITDKQVPKPQNDEEDILEDY